MDQLRSVQGRLVSMEVDIERLQREADEQWRTFERSSRLGALRRPVNCPDRATFPRALQI